jgi:hypothetical protein
MRIVSAAVLITAFTIGAVFPQDPPAGSSHPDPDPAPAPVAPASPSNQAQPRGQTGPNAHNDWGRTSIQPAGRYAGWNAIAPARCAARGDRSKNTDALKRPIQPTQLYKVKFVAAAVKPWLDAPSGYDDF